MRLKLRCSTGQNIEDEVVDEVVTDNCIGSPAFHQDRDDVWILDYIQEGDLEPLKKEFGKNDIEVEVVAPKCYFIFDRTISEVDFKDMLEMSDISDVTLEVTTKDPKCWAIYEGGVNTEQIPEFLNVKRAKGRRVETLEEPKSVWFPVWFHPLFSEEDTSKYGKSWKDSLNKKGMFKNNKTPGFRSAVLDMKHGAIGIEFETAEFALAWINDNDGVMRMTFEGAEKAKEYTLSMSLDDPSAQNASSSDQNASSSAQNASNPAQSASSPAKNASSVSAASEQEISPEPVVPGPTPREIEEELWNLPSTPLSPNSIRVHLSKEGKYKDVEVQPGDIMHTVYEETAVERGPGGVVVNFPSRDEAIDHSLPAVGGTEFAIQKCYSVPIVLPTEVRMQVKAGFKDVSLAQMRELLCTGGSPEYQCFERDDEYTFKHRSKRPSASILTPVETGIKRLDPIMRNRKVGFLSAVGTPRSGKSTLLSLIQRHYNSIRQDSTTSSQALFACSDSTARPCTSGLWVSIQELTNCCFKKGLNPLKDPSNIDADSVVLLIDSEGLFAANQSNMEYFVRIFTITTVLSSCVIFNNTISSVVAPEFREPLARLAALYRGFCERNSWIRKQIPTLLYLARDWNTLQDLDEDNETWLEAERLAKGDDQPNPDQVLDDALQFTQNVFGSIRLATLPNPVADLDKENIVKRPLAPEFEDKLAKIITHRLGPYLTPKSFKSGGETIHIRGSIPLLDLVSNTVEAVTQASDESFRSMDWQCIVDGFVKESALHHLEWVAKEIADAANTTYSRFTVVLPPGTDMKPVLKAAMDAGLKHQIKSSCEFALSGPPSNIRHFISKEEIASLNIKPPQIDSVKEFLEREKAKWHRELENKLTPFGYTPYVIADLLTDHIHTLVEPLMELASEMIVILSNIEIARVKLCLKTDLESAAMRPQVLNCRGSAVKALHALQKRFSESSDVIEHVEAEVRHVEEVCQSILDRPDKVVGGVVLTHFLEALEIHENLRMTCNAAEIPDVDLSLLLADETVSGDQIFCPKNEIPRANNARFLRLSDSVSYALKTECCLVQNLPMEEKQNLTLIHCQLAEEALSRERDRRMISEIERLFKSFDIPNMIPLEHRAASAVSKLLDSNWTYGESEMFEILLQSMGLSSLCDRESCVIACDAMSQLLQRSPPDEKQLGNMWAPRLRKAIAKVCESTAERVCREFQVALLSENKETLQKCLEMQDITAWGIEVLSQNRGQGRSWFRVLLASEDMLDKLFASRRDDGFLPFQQIAMHPPSLQWVAPRSDDAVTCWKDYLDVSSTSETELIFKPEFIEWVAQFPNKDRLKAIKTYVDITVRLPVVAYPVPLEMTQEDAEQLAADSKCLRFVTMGQVALIVIESTPTKYTKFQQIEQVEISKPSGPIIVMRGPPKRGEWVCSDPPSSLKNMYASKEVEIVKEAKSQLLSRLRSQSPTEHIDLEKVKDELPELLKTKGLPMDSTIVTEALQGMAVEVRILSLEIRSNAYVEKLCAFLEVSQDSFPTPTCQILDEQQSDEDILELSLEPVVHEMDQHIRTSSHIEWLSKLEKKKRQTERFLSKYLERFQESISYRLNELLAAKRLELFADKMGVTGDDKVNLLYFGSRGHLDPKDANNAQELAQWIFWLHGRRFVPEEMLTDVEVEVADTIKKIRNMFLEYDECRSSADFRYQGAPDESCILRYIAFVPLDNTFVYLTRNQIDFTQMPQICGLNASRPLRCQLRTKKDSLEAFACLDKYRPHAFVKEMKEAGDYTEVTLSVWHKFLPSMLLPGFELLHMKIARNMYSRRQQMLQSGFQVSTSESVFFASRFNTTFVELPEGISPNAEDLHPSDYQLPQSLPDESADVDMMCANFPFVNQDVIVAVKGREWSPESCIKLLHRFQQAREGKQSVRVVVMAHTRSICQDRGYVTKSSGKYQSFPPPGETKTFRAIAPGPMPRYGTTLVVFNNTDTISAAEKARASNSQMRILALNMANRNEAGGGYAKGSMAQEEDIFRRTDLSSRLVRGYCKDSPEYPLKEFVPVVTANVVAFRGSEEDGYYLLNSAFTFDVISAAAYNAGSSRSQQETFPVLEGQGREKRFSQEGFLRTCCNINAILSAAAQHGADHLILGALGCGAFANPRAEVASIFAELLPYYGGCFKVIEFAIVDNGNGNLSTFEKLIPHYLKETETVGCSWLCGSSICSICPDLALCTELRRGKRGCQLSHPDWCPSLQDCANNSQVHRRLYRHKQKCTDPSCMIMFGPRDGERGAEYERHNSQYTHKEVCTQDHCNNPNHLHPIACSLGIKCPKKNQRHDDGYFYSHVITQCPFGTACLKWNDADHCRSFKHPFLQPCANAMLCQSLHIDAHRLSYAHFCHKGQDCELKNEASHSMNWMHPERQVCKQGANCRAFEQSHYEDHLDLFHHPGIKLFREPCPENLACCKIDDPAHVQKYRHTSARHRLPACKVWGHNTTRHLLESLQTSTEVDFDSNAKAMIERVKSWSKCKEDPSALQTAIRIFKSFRAVHRLSVPTFSKLLMTGFLASLHCLQAHSKHADFAMMLPTVASLSSRYPQYASYIQEAVESTIVQQLGQDLQGPQNMEGSQEGVPQFQGNANMQDCQRRWGLLGGLPQLEVMAMRDEAENFLKAMKDLEEETKKSMEAGTKCELGIAHDKDRIMETNKMSFAILGPHTLNYGVDEKDEHCQGVHLIFSSSALHHPDVFITPMAATFYSSGLGDEHRPWWAEFAGKDKEPFKAMVQEKLHPSSPLCHEALAWEFLARVSAKEKKPLSTVSVEDMMKYLKGENAHVMAEVHLPYVTPLTFVESLVISKHSWERLSRKDQDHSSLFWRGKVEVVPGTDSSTVQWARALANTSLLPPQAFSFTFLPTRTTDVVLPVVIRNNQGKIFFRASMPEFTITLASGRNAAGLPHNPYAFVVRGSSCNVVKGLDVLHPIEKKENFNRELRAEDAAMYCLEFKQVSHGGQCLVFRHAGASRTWNSEEVAVKCTDRLRTVIFTAQRALVAFTDVRVVSDDQEAYEYEKTWQLVPSVVPPDPHEKPTVVGPQTKVISTAQKVLAFFTGSSEKARRPLCPAGFRCVAAFGITSAKRSESQRQHMAEYRHLCLYGQSCTEINDEEHMLASIHLEKPVCTARRCDGPCDQMDDFYHRFAYHHTGDWDVLLPCRKGSSCQDCLRDPRHSQRYHHHAIEYLVEDDGSIRVQEGSPDAPPNSTRRDSGDEKDYATMFTNLDVEVQDSIDDMAGIYNEDAINGNFEAATYDEHGVPIGSQYDLAPDGSLKGYRVLIGCFYLGERLREDLEELTIPELRRKGWEEQIEVEMDAFTTAMRDGKFHVAWIISDKKTPVGNAEAFVAEIHKFHQAGRGLMIWADNDPFFVHANLILEKLFSFRLEGSTDGGKDLVPGDPNTAGHFGSHLVVAGLTKLNEGSTICYPNRVPDEWLVFGTSTDGKPVLLTKDAKNRRRGPGRVVVDNGFTKLMKSQWTTAGTPRYVQNCCTYLAFRERFRYATWGWDPVPT